MERVLETHRFGSHEVVVLEHVEDEGITYSVLVDDQPVTPQPLSTPPGFEDVVRLYSKSSLPPAGAPDGTARDGRQEEATEPPR